MKRLFATFTGIAVAAFMSLSLAGPASAANETATVGLTMTPQSGQLSTTQPRPVDWRVNVEVKAPASSAQVQPMKRVKASFPKNMSFNPKSNTPVCPDSQIGPKSNLSFPPDTVIARCPDAVLGNGTAGLYLAKNNSPAGPTLIDPVLIVFNGGTNSKGQAVIKIYGYSQGTGAGIYMEGALVNDVLDIKIPVLTYDSAVGDFNLNIPGSNAPQVNRRGVDKTYVKTTCSTGTWLTNAKFTLGTRNTAGSATSPDYGVDAPQASTSCHGVKTQSGKFANLKVKGKSKVKKGKKYTYKVKVKNRGNANIKHVKVVVNGKGVKGKKKVKLGTLKKGHAKWAKLKLKFKKKGKVKLKVKANGRGAHAKVKRKTVKVK